MSVDSDTEIPDIGTQYFSNNTEIRSSVEIIRRRRLRTIIIKITPQIYLLVQSVSTVYLLDGERRVYRISDNYNFLTKRMIRRFVRNWHVRRRLLDEPVDRNYLEIFSFT